MKRSTEMRRRLPLPLSFRGWFARSLSLSMSMSPSWAWLVVFVPALSYLVRTRLQSYTAWAGNVGQPLAGARLVRLVADKEEDESDPLACRELSKAFYYVSVDPAATCPTELRVDAAVVVSNGLRCVTDSLWRHDSGLGRGYVLVSESHGNGRVWRWEVGGGPIAIGKTLQLERSGCRSGLHRRCWQDDAEVDDVDDKDGPTKDVNASRPVPLLGSGGMTIDFLGKDHFDEGQLVVAEWGERRIVRLEESGARTPLVLTGPDLCQNGEHRGNATMPMIRLQQPTRMLYTPRGDLLFVDHHPDCRRSGLFILRKATKVEPLASLPESRAAHAWTDLSHGNFTTELVQLASAIDVDGKLMSEGVERIGGAALAPGPSEAGALFLVAQLSPSRRIVLLRHVLYGDDESRDEDHDDAALGESSERSGSTVVVVDLTPQARSGDEASGNPGSVAVSNDFAFVTTGNHVLVIQQSTHRVLGRIEVATDSAQSSFTSITLGGDGYLYVTTQKQLIRIRVKQGPLKHPTKLVPKSAVRSSTS